MKLSKIFSSVALICLMVTACQPEKLKSYVDIEANANLVAISGTWKLVKVVQTDNDAAKKGFPYQTMDITSAFAYTTATMTFNLSAGAPTTFAINNGTAPGVVAITTGNWTVDNAKAPQVITLTNGAVSEKLTLGSYPNAVSPNLKVRVTRSDVVTGKVLVTYDYEYSR